MKYVVYSDDRYGKFSPSGLFDTWQDAYNWQQIALRWADNAWVEAVETYDLCKYQELQAKYNA